MNGIASLQETPAQAGTVAGSRKQTLGKEDFLKLLVAQLKNQDPLKPSDPTEFTAQLAQYSSLEQLHNINESMQALNGMQDSFGRLSALSLIDKTVVSESNTLNFQGEPVELGFRFQDPVERASIYVKNAEGQIVDKIDVENPSPGENPVYWDGKGDDGQTVPAGPYSFTVIGTLADGTEIQGGVSVESRVTGVDFSDSANTLLTTNGRIEWSDVVRVKNPTSSVE